MFSPAPYLAVLSALLGAAVVWRTPAGSVRRTGAAVSVLTLALALAAAWPVISGARPDDLLSLDPITSVPFPLFAALTLATFAAAPRRDMAPKPAAGLLTILAGTLLAYAATDLRICLAGWALTLAPFWMKSFEDEPAPSFRLAGALSAACVLGAAIAAGMEGSTAAAWAGFGLLVVAAFLRKGVTPLHSWVVLGGDRGNPLALNLIANGHLGALVLARFGIKIFGPQSMEASGWIGILALAASMHTAILAVGARRSRRVLTMISVSQACFILAGLVSRTQVGITGAYVHWIVVAVATTGMWLIYRMVEVRCPRAAEPSGYLGLGSRMPRLAVFFAVCGLGLVGLPGTLGFAAEDLLIHGALDSQPLLGYALPVATALNAITLLRLFSRIFLGQPVTRTPGVPDARPGERWALAACVIVLVAGGLVPQMVVSIRRPAADALLSPAAPPAARPAHSE